ncbi:cysteine dioxygenase [Peribacillus sp. SCS-37]|uniref:cysteine dioxygenase n=1 Tax=Paraperibacillus esterisolvens TaxID=3115296 RepID=UPI003905812E
MEKVREVLDLINQPTRKELKKALLDLELTLEDVKPLLRTAEGRPYYRKLLYHNEEVEMLVMNWSQLECAPHDHGASQGWIKVLSGSSLNTVYKVDGNGWPEELFEELHQDGKLFYAPRKGVHKMKAAGPELVTLHLYSPPISGMKVYDLEACAACIVSDECGAWWPEELAQEIKKIQLEKQKKQLPNK